MHVLSTILTSNGYQVIVARNGQEAKQLTSSYCPDVVLLDLGLPDLDGLEVLEQIRSWSGKPVLVVSARDDEREKVRALDMGADDYITKPFGTSELLARIRAAVRRSQGVVGAEKHRYTVGNLTVDWDKRSVTIGGQDVHLTQNEFRIVGLLASQPGRVLTYDYILEQIWGPYHLGDNKILRVNMANIRRKLEVNPAEPRYILTEVGVGYRLADEED